MNVFIYREFYFLDEKYTFLIYFFQTHAAQICLNGAIWFQNIIYVITSSMDQNAVARVVEPDVVS
jgi:hypothetical protein